MSYIRGLKVNVLEGSKDPIPHFQRLATVYIENIVQIYYVSYMIKPTDIKNVYIYIYIFSKESLSMDFIIKLSIAIHHFLSTDNLVSFISNSMKIRTTAVSMGPVQFFL